MPQVARVKILFHDALELRPDVDVRSWLEARCAGDETLLQEVWSLLEARAEMQRCSLPQTAIHQEVPTAHFGAYRAVELVGRGGMSTVYRARRADGNFEQTAALKIMAGYLAGGEFQRRFETERRLLAALNHHHITRLLDGGVSSAGDLYLITEFVEGQTIDRYCDERKLSVEARLRILLQVCDAVEYAHANLIVHRDLKPGNILVDRDGMVKLVDFGTASLMETDAAVTLTRARMVTPRYASPEQLRGERITTATDIFSIGVVLYELLTGAWPFGNPNSVLSELHRATGEVTPTTPSTAVGEEAALCRSMTRGQLSHLLRGDLAIIVLKALEFESARRYLSVRELASDIQNFLAGRPVLARRQTFAYRTGKFVRRHWLAVGAAALFVTGLSTASIVALRQAQVARAEALKAERISNFLSSMMSSGTRWGSGFTVAQMLDGAEPEIEKMWKEDPLTEASIRTNLGASYTTLQHPERAQFELGRALDIYRSRGDSMGAAKVLWIMGQNALAQGHLRDSSSYYRQTLASLPASSNVDTSLWLFRVKRDLGTVLSYSSQADLQEACILLEQAVALGLQDSSIPKSELLFAQGNYGRVLADQGKGQEAEAVFQQAFSLARREKLEAGTVATLQAKIWIDARQGDLAGARDLARRQYDLLLQSGDDDQIWTACASLYLARFLAETGDISGALARLRTAMPTVRKNMQPGNVFLWGPLTSASHVLLAADQVSEAERYARESLAVVDDAQRDEVDPWRAESLLLVGTALSRGENRRDAQPFLRRAWAIYSHLGPVWSTTAEHVQEMMNDEERRLAADKRR